ncbi:MAG: MaoC family dehydratase [Ruminococcus sp.]|nr:MaoC family dehydratase [Ruminococcus sp.]
MKFYKFEDMKIGLSESFSVEVNEDMMKRFGEITGDVNPLHCNEHFAHSRGYENKVCYGMLTASFLSTLAGVYLPGKNSLIHSVELNFTKPVLVGSQLTIKGTVMEINEVFRYVVLKTEITDQNGKKVLRGKMEVGVDNG